MGFCVWGFALNPINPGGLALRVTGVEEPGLKCRRLRQSVQIYFYKYFYGLRVNILYNHFFGLGFSHSVFVFMDDFG